MLYIINWFTLTNFGVNDRLFPDILLENFFSCEVSVSISLSLSLLLLRCLFDTVVHFCFTYILINECTTYQITVNQNYLTNIKLNSVQHMLNHNTFSRLYDSLVIILFH
jgi:hypothetical protein